MTPTVDEAREALLPHVADMWQPKIDALIAAVRAAALDEARAAVQSVIFDLPIGNSVDYSRGYSAAVAENRRSLFAAIDALQEGADKP